MFLSLDVRAPVKTSKRDLECVCVRNREQRAAVSGGAERGGGESSLKSAPSSSHCEVI